MYASLQFPNYRLVSCSSSSFVFGYKSTFMQRCAGRVVHVHLMLIRRCTTCAALFNPIMLRMSISALPIMTVPMSRSLPVKRWRKRFAATWKTFFCRDASLCLHMRSSDRLDDNSKNSVMFNSQSNSTTKFAPQKQTMLVATPGL